MTTQARAGSSSRDPGEWLSIAFILLTALTAQLVAARAGAFSLAADDSARTLLSDGLPLGNAFDPFFWLPLPKVVYGVGLWVHDNLFVTPRIITHMLGFCLIASVAYLAHRLFASKTVVLVAAALCAVLSHRVLFSAAPMAEAIYNPLMVMAFAFFVGVARDLNRRDIFLTCVFLALACATRYEAWFMTAAFGLYLAWTCFVRRALPFSDLMICAAIVSVFPLFWITNAALSDQGIGAILVTSQQAEAIGTSMYEAIRNSHLYIFIRDLLLTPLIVALVPVTTLFATERSKRTWIAGAVLSLLLVTAVSLASGSVAYAVPWRLGGVWILILVPFLAYWIVNLCRQCPPRLRLPALLGAVAITMGAFSLQTLERIKDAADYRSFTHGDLSAGRFARDWLNDHDGNVLVEAENSFKFLNILVASNTPERMVLSTGDDVQMVALHVMQADYWETADPEVYEAHAAPKYGLASGGDLAQLRARDIGLVLVETPDYAEALKTSGPFEQVAEFDGWTVFSVRPPAAKLEERQGR